MKLVENNYAFIDSQNLNLSIKSLGWNLNFRKFRIYLREKYFVKIAYLFIGYVKGNNRLYKILQEAGFVCIFKPTLLYSDGKMKGNCDAELILQAMIDLKFFDKAVIVTGGGDFYCLIKYLIRQNKLKVVLIPNRFRYSTLLKFKIFKPFLRFVNELRNKLEYKKEKTL